jgi:hypothetical protein
MVDPMTNVATCPAQPQFGDDGLPVDSVPLSQMPIAIGGMAYYRPGDSETVVALGCTDQQRTTACVSDNSVQFTASVEDFDTSVPIAETLAMQLQLVVGEPHPTINPGEYVLNPDDTRGLDLTSTTPQPEWSANVDLMFANAACVQVIDFGATNIRPMLTCKGVTTGQKMIDIQAYRVSQATLDQVIALVNSTDATRAIPSKGIVVGIVVDDAGNAKAGVPLSSSTGSIQVLSADRKSLLAGMTTTTSGMFISQDATFGTTFTAHGATMVQDQTGYGGLVDGKATVVVIQFPKLQGN